MSDTYNCLGESEILEDVQVSVALQLCFEGSTDEGRAIIELIHSIAPEASFIFASGLLGLATAAQAVDAMSGLKVDIIVDDIGYLNEATFQNDVWSRAINSYVDNGGMYFSSAGNSAKNFYYSKFRPARKTYTAVVSATATIQVELHEFNDKRVSVPFALAQDESFLGALQWDETYARLGQDVATSSYRWGFLQNDVVFFFNEILQSTDPQFISGTACIGEPTCTAELVFARLSGTEDHAFSFLFFGSAPDFSNEPQNSRFGIIGHSSARGSTSVGAAVFHDTPSFGQSPAILEPFSSYGVVPLLRNDDGSKRRRPFIAKAPFVVGPDGLPNSFFGGRSLGHSLFYGTSASAPCVAAVAALLSFRVSTSYSDVLDALARGASDMNERGFDEKSGHGYVNAVESFEIMKRDARCQRSEQCEDGEYCGQGFCQRQLPLIAYCKESDSCAAGLVCTRISSVVTTAACLPAPPTPAPPASSATTESKTTDRPSTPDRPSTTDNPSTTETTERPTTTETTERPTTTDRPSTTETTQRPATTTDQREGWERFQGHSYKYFSSRKVTHESAERTCVSEGGHLASIHSERENEFVSDLAQGNSKNRPIWLGAVKDRSDEFVYIDGTRFGDFTNFFSGEPSSNKEKCLAMGHAKKRSEDQWNDSKCSNRFYFVCKV
eukprot:m.84876 g.84876  ORF g.84876 m.84876 type:complete len:667 (+) comp21224_c0_seq2:66-2066(+)